MLQLHLNNLLVFHRHKDRTNELNIATCLNDFVKVMNTGQVSSGSLLKKLWLYFRGLSLTLQLCMASFLCSDSSFVVFN